LFSIVYCGFALQPSTAVIFLLFLIYGFYAAATEGISKAWITNIAHDSNTATAVGFYTSCQSVCSLLASIIAGVIWTAGGSSLTFFVTASVALIVAFYFMFKK
jgi:MFS family permease